MPDKFGWDNNFGNSRPPSRRELRDFNRAPDPLNDPDWEKNSEPNAYHYREENCPGHVASPHDGKICARCGTHADSLIPPEEDWF